MSRTTKVDLSKGAHLNEPQRNDPEDPKEVLDRLSPRGQQQEWTTKLGAVVDPTGRHYVMSGEIADAINAAVATERQRCEQRERENRQLAQDYGKLNDKFLSALAAIEKLVKMYVANLGDPDSEFISCIGSSHASDLTAKERKNDKLWSARDAARKIDLSVLHEHDAKVRSKADKDWREQVAELITEHEQELAEVREPLVDLATAMLKALKTVPVNYVTPQLCEGDIKRWDDALANVQRSNVSTETKNHESTPVRPENL